MQKVFRTQTLEKRLLWFNKIVSYKPQHDFGHTIKYLPYLWSVLYFYNFVYYIHTMLWLFCLKRSRYNGNSHFKYFVGWYINYVKLTDFELNWEELFQYLITDICWISVENVPHACFNFKKAYMKQNAKIYIC